MEELKNGEREGTYLRRYLLSTALGLLVSAQILPTAEANDQALNLGLSGTSVAAGANVDHDGTGAPGGPYNAAGFQIGPWSWNDKVWSGYYDDYNSFDDFHFYEDFLWSDERDAPARRPEAFETEEFNANFALGQVRAQNAYSAGATGASSVVAVIDENFDLTHPDLAPNIVDFRDITFNLRQPNPNASLLEQRAHLLAGELFPIGHGTNVSGVIAAVRNDRQTHGIAPEAGIIAIRADRFEAQELLDPQFIPNLVNSGLPVIIGNEADGSVRRLFADSAEDAARQIEVALQDENLRIFAAVGGFLQEDLVRGIDLATERGADVVNLSLGGFNENGEALIASIQRATEQDVVIVFASGNSAGPNPTKPADLAGDPRTNGLLLAVSAVDADNNIANFSERCGTSKERCLVAPGVGVVTTINGGGIAPLNGTSFAAPIVSGSLALLKDLFPTISGEEAVEILLTSATDLGEPGADEIFGRGLVNLERAVQPIGVASLPLDQTIRGRVVNLAVSNLNLGTAFGDALSSSRTLSQGLFLDGFRRPFKFDLRNQVRSAQRDIDFNDILAPSSIRSRGITVPNGWNLAMSYQPAPEGGAALSGDRQSERSFGDIFESARLAGELTDDLSFSAGVNLTAGQQLGETIATSETAGLFLNSGESLGPQHGLLDKGQGFSLTQDLGDSTALTIGLFDSNGSGSDDGGRGRLAQFDLSHQFDSGAAIGLRTAFAAEAEGFLGSQGDGAFGDSQSADSLFYTLSSSLPLPGGLEAFGSYTLAVADLSGVEGGVVSDLRDVRADAFAMGLVKKDLVEKGDSLGFMFSQPLRVASGASAEVSVASSVNDDGSIVTGTERVGLEPSGRELNLQLVYGRQFLPGLNLSGYALTRIQPGHDADAEKDFGADVRLNFRF